MKPKEVPSIQADNLNKILILIKALLKSSISIKEVEHLINVGERNADYYANAIVRMKLAKYDEQNKKIKTLKITELGKFYFGEHAIRHRLCDFLEDTNFINNESQKIINSENEATTKKRRLHSMESWNKWIVKEKQKYENLQTRYSDVTKDFWWTN